MRDEIKEYLAWRRKTRFIRRHGGLLPACTIIAATALLLWQRAKARRETTTAMPARKPSPAVVEEVPREAPDDSMSDDPAEAGQTESLLSSNPADQQQTREAMMRWQKAETALKGFFASKSDKERLAWVSPAERTSEHLAVYASRFPAAAWFSLPEKIGTHFALQDRHLITSVQFPGQRPRHIAVETATDGTRVDWEGYVGFCEKSFREVADMRPPDEPVLLRAEVYRASPPPPEFDAKTHLAVMLRHPDDGVALQAVAKREDLDQTKAGHAFVSNLPGRYTPRVRPPSAQPPAGWLLVSEIVCPGWMPALYARASTTTNDRR